MEACVCARVCARPLKGTFWNAFSGVGIVNVLIEQIHIHMYIKSRSSNIAHTLRIYYACISFTKLFPS